MDEAGKLDPALVRQCFDLGLMGIETPEEYGGAGASFFTAILAVEELSRVDASVGVFVDVQNTLVNNAILRWGNPEQKKKYLGQLASERVGAYALSEAGSGSDAFALATRAADAGDHYVLNGRKLWITNGNEAELFIVFANANPEAGYKGITAFLVEKSCEGFSVGKKENKLGIRASSTTELILEDCRVPKENVLGEVGKGYKVSIETLNEGRIGIGAQMIGIARGALEAALRYTSEREQFGRAVNEFQGVQFQLAEPRWRNSRRRGPPSASAPAPSSSTAATASSKTTRSRNSGATPRSAPSTRAPRTCSCRRLRNSSSEGNEAVNGDG
jgi:butyryl-CoA dehydrogenase/short/branched chain acyl-CoA dehydrogenase